MSDWIGTTTAAIRTAENESFIDYWYAHGSGGDERSADGWDHYLSEEFSTQPASTKEDAIVLGDLLDDYCSESADYIEDDEGAGEEGLSQAETFQQIERIHQDWNRLVDQYFAGQ